MSVNDTEPGWIVQPDVNGVFYYEAHITIEPAFDEAREGVAEICRLYGFRLAELLMKKRQADSLKRSQFDTFATGRSRDVVELTERTLSLALALRSGGFQVWRYKVESTLLDSNCDDSALVLDRTGFPAKYLEPRPLV